MTKTLILMRHAKSDWNDPLSDDHDRPLNGRGRISATALGDWLRMKGILPDQALVSSATRTRETFARLDVTCDASFSDALYLASAGRMLSELKRATGQTVLMLGHNPGIAGFAHDLVKTQPKHARFHDYPTCATLVAEFKIDHWGNLVMGTGRVREFVIPRELTA